MFTSNPGPRSQISPIVLYPDPVLRTVCAPVAEFDEQLATLVSSLANTLYSSSGIGLAAPQIGVSEQVLVMDLSEDHSDLSVYINPRITNKAGLAIVEETCLSLPGVAAKILRAGMVNVSAFDAQGCAFEQELDGMQAVCLQHELDHLHGKLFIDRLSRVRRWGVRKALNKLETQTQQEPALQN